MFYLKTIKKVIKVLLIYLLLLSINSFASTSLLFCYEDKPLAPHFYGEGSAVPKNAPGATIEIMQQLDVEFNELNVIFIKKQEINKCIFILWCEK